MSLLTDLFLLFTVILIFSEHITGTYGLIAFWSTLCSGLFAARLLDRLVEFFEDDPMNERLTPKD